MKEKPAEVGIESVDPDGIVKNIAIYILCGLLNYAGSNP